MVHDEAFLLATNITKFRKDCGPLLPAVPALALEALEYKAWGLHTQLLEAIAARDANKQGKQE